jgi:predicted nucleotidyltransferase
MCTNINLDTEVTSEEKRLKAKANFEKFEKERLQRMAKQLQRKQLGIEKERIKMADLKNQFGQV